MIMRMFSLAALLAAASCAQSGSNAQPDIRGAWTVIEIDGTPIPADVPVTVNFAEGGQINGVGGCNHYGGTYAYKNGVVTISQMIMTEMACMAEERMGLEAKFHYRMQDDLNVSLQPDGALELRDEEGRLLMRRQG